MRIKCTQLSIWCPQTMTKGVRKTNNARHACRWFSVAHVRLAAACCKHLIRIAFGQHSCCERTSLDRVAKRCASAVSLQNIHL